LNLEMIQLQLNEGDVPREIPSNVRSTYVEPGESATFALCFDYHTRLLFNVGLSQPRS